MEYLLAEARRDFLFYVRLCNPKYIISDMHVYLAKKLQGVFDDISKGKSRRLLISCPPRTGKSQMVSIEFPTWLMGKEPWREVMVAGYAQEFINKHSRSARNRVWYDPTYKKIFPKTKIIEGDSQVREWAVSGGGRYKAVGVQGQATGAGTSCLIIDDPIKSIEEALSEHQLEKIWDAFLANLYTRLTPSGNAVIVIQTRWSKDDLIGRLMSKEFKGQLEAAGINDEWEHINLPALAEENDPLMRKPGEPLCVERFSIESWNEKKATQTDYIWAALYCGHPVAKGGNYIQMDRVETVPWEDKMRTWTWMRYWDLAATENKTSDYTVGIRGAIDADTKTLYLHKGIRMKAAWPVARERIKDTAVNEKTMIGVESNSGFKTATANLREVLPPSIMLQETTVAADKLARALSWIAMAKNWKVKFVTDSKGEETWISEFKEELSAWPYSAHDDILDSISGVEKMLNSHLVIFKEAGGLNFTTSMNDRRNRSLQG